MSEDRDRLRELLQAADCVPPAPDCRGAVMAGIGEPRTGLRLAWMYACAAVIILAVACGDLLLRAPNPTTKQPTIVHRATVPQPAPRKKQVAEAPPVEPERIVVRQQVEPVHHSRFVPQRRTAATHQAKQQTPAHTVPKPPVPDMTAQKPPVVEPEKQPVALVLVTFPSGETTSDTSYEYTDRNTETGEVTKCSVTRTGNEIDIHLETTSGDEANPPVKGCVNCGNTSNA